MACVCIIGSGPAGVSAALYTARAGLDTTVITQGSGSLDRAEKIENYYGFSGPISGAELERTGIAGAKRLGVRFITAEVVGLSFGDKLTVETEDAAYAADAVVLATGAARRTPKIPGLAALEGKGVSYCAVCDGFFYRGKDVAVLGSGSYALHEAAALLPLARTVTLVTGGADLEVETALPVRTEPIAAVEGAEQVAALRFSSGPPLPISGLFVAQGVAGSTDLARKIGATLDNNRIVVDENMATNIPGLYAAGDCTGGLLQVSKAVYEGAVAGIALSKYLRRGTKAAEVEG